MTRLLRAIRDRALSWPALLAGAGLLFSGLAVLDPARPGGRVLGPALACLALLAGARRGSWRPLLAPCVLAAAFAVTAWVGPRFRGDSWSYYEYLRSAAFDRDLDFTNERETWGFQERRLTATGLRRSVHAVGPALLWSPFYLVAHLYVLLDDGLLGGRYPPDGYSAPYLRAPALGTLAIAMAGAALLLRMMAARFGPVEAALAVAGAVTTSPLLYYLFVVPSMAHGVVFGVAAALLWAWDRARRCPSLSAWMLLGGLLGLLALTRWQAAVYALLVVPLALEGLVRRRVSPSWLGAAGGAGLLAFLPQLGTWKVLYGRFLTIPQGAGFLDWSSPHLVDTLISADHGLYSWTPVMLAGTAGLLWGLRASPLLHGGALLVLAASAWLNGCVVDWAAGDAFGARRFDLVVPLMALGLGVVIERTVPALKRAPLLAPAAALLLAGFWNVGLIVGFQEGKYPHAAPLDRVAGQQGRLLRLLVQDVLGRVGGAGGRALAYKYFSGEYYFANYGEGGVINLTTLPEGDLTGGWSAVRRKPGEPGFRWALPPESCVRIPLEGPVELRAVVTVRAPQAETMTALLNGEVVGAASLGTEWTEVPLVLSARTVLSGENVLCLRFSGSQRVDSDESVAAAVATIRLP